MIDQVAAAFERQDYKTAAQLLKQLLKQSPQDPWVQLYLGRLQEVQGKLDPAEAIYRQLLRDTTNPKVAIQARQGLQHLEALKKTRRQEAIAQASANPPSTGAGLLVLEPVTGSERPQVARNLAKILSLDAYTAQLHLPSRGWRLYRTGAVGEIQVYAQELQQAGIPAFWCPLADTQKIRVFRVHYLQAIEPQLTVICQNEENQIGSLSFDWSEVSRRVRGLLPIFEDVVDLDARNKLKRKEATQDYAQVYDLHLESRNCILRICDISYQFQQGVAFDQPPDGHLNPLQMNPLQMTLRTKWNRLSRFLDQQLADVALWSDFTVFAESALEQLELVSSFESHIDLFRKEATNWDPAFQLYSSLVFLYATLKQT